MRDPLVLGGDLPRSNRKLLQNGIDEDLAQSMVDRDTASEMEFVHILQELGIEQ